MLRDVVVAGLAGFAAEFGDKSQVAVLALATKLGARIVIGGLVLSIGVLQLLSALGGSALGSLLTGDTATAVAGATFVVVGVWVIATAAVPDPSAEAAETPRRGTLLFVALTLVLAELGDKTMLTTAALATERSVVGSWLGGTAGVLVADLGVIALGRRVPPTRVPLLQRVLGAVTLAVGLAVVVNALS